MENNLSRSGSRSSSVCELEKDFSDMEIIKSRTNRRNVMIRTPLARKAKRVRFFRNGDKFYSGVIIPVLPERYRSFDSLTADLTRVLVDNVTLPSGVRTIYSLEGRKIGKLDDLEDGQSYVCSGFGEPFKRLDYEASAVTPQSFRLSGPESLSDSASPSPARANNKGSRCFPANGSSTTSNGTARISPAGDSVVRPRIVTIIRNGVKPRKVCRLLLNKRNSPTLEHALAAITECIKLDTGCVRKVFTQSGTPISALHHFFEDEDVFFAYGNERVNQEDFELEFEESKAVLQCRKTPITRNSRVGPKPRMPVKAGGAARAASAAGAAAADDDRDDGCPALPQPLRLKYSVGKIIGDGNFAVVRICKDKTTGNEYALKVIDKAKCKGKEHYVEAEVRVMRKLCHPRIVSLIEEQDSPEWLFLIMELVSGGSGFRRQHPRPEAGGLRSGGGGVPAAARRLRHPHVRGARDPARDGIWIEDRRVGGGRDPVYLVVWVPAVLVPGRRPGDAVRRHLVGAAGVPGAALGAGVGGRHRPRGQHAAAAA
ncbi:serine/threonine-protein kinase GA29083 isoform X2 [Plodia interpunctella]|uniref:serine/threonine-protein kinase GA29083 isoform X2 n=1 Tax=Plodia interpunctella TaxID=58824 RepID=UPI0023684BD0|nr:serine/threonine-protein kinase GA29083 isoform X2 [Plodia interpunctella]